MPALGTATVSLVAGSRRIGGRNERRCRAKIVTGDASSTYPSGGVGLPSKLGIFSRSLEVIDFYDTGADSIIYQWDSTNNKLRMFWPTQQTGSTGNRAGAELATSDVPALNVTLYAEVVGT